MGKTTKVLVRLGADSDQRKEYLNRLRLRAWVTEGLDSPVLVATLRLSSDGTARIPDVPNDHSSIEIELTDTAGRSLFGPKDVKRRNGDFIIDLDDQATDRIPAATPGRTEPRRRYGRFRVLLQPSFRFDGMSLSVTTVSANQEQRLRKELPDSQPAAEGWVAVGTNSEAVLKATVLQSTKLGFDGAFDLEFDPVPAAVGWIYAITGPETYVGFVPDKMVEIHRKGITIFLPLEIDDGEDESRPLVSDTQAEQPLDIPLDASEGEILDNPDLFSDDPGPFCKPFRNPERVLGERRFQTILRSEQPEILGASQKKIKKLPDYMTLQDVLPVDRLAIAAGRLAERKVLVDLRNTGMQRQIPLSGNTRRRSGRQAPGPNTLIDWENDVLSKQAITVSGGYILEWSVRWRSNGYSLGPVNHTLTLAPRQIKRLIKIDFERSERARREEITTVDDEVTQTTDYTRDYANAVRSSLREWARGASESAAAGAGIGAGGLVGNAVIGGGGAAGGAVSASQQDGGRSATAAEEQNLRDAIRQHGESLRQLESTVITETNQRETTEGVSEIIANPNYCHALTIVYYNILRHLRVDTELAGVSECLFVPFTITPFAQVSQDLPGRFDVRRIIRHRDALKSALRDRTLAWAFPYLEDYTNFFMSSSIPAGRRMDQVVVSLRGSIDIRISVASPLKGDEDARAMEEAADAGADDRETAANVVKWIGVALTPFSALGIGVAAAGAALAEVAANQREALFESEIAPIMVRKFVNALKLFVNGRQIPTDFTLQGGYRKGGSHRVHFQVSAKILEQEGITRADLEEVQIRDSSRSDLHLPNFSVANATAGRIQVSTPTYRRTLTDRGLYDDLIEVSTNPNAEKAISGMAILSFPASNWEKEDLRQSITNQIERLVQHLDSHQFHYHKAIWWQMDPDELFTVLDGYTLSATDRRSIASLVEYRPLAIVGNALVFRVARGAFVGVNGMQSLEEVRAFYEPRKRNSDPMRVSLPTGGVYAQALMDECPACEEHAGSTDWVLDEEQLTPQELDSGLLSSRRQAPANMTPTSLPGTLINLQNAPAAPAPSGLSEGFAAATNANAFRDMAGLAGTQANARAALEAGASLAKTFGNLGAKQMNAERDAISKINRDKSLTPEDKQSLKQKYAAPPTERDPVEQAKEFPGQVEITKSSTGGATPQQETTVKATNSPVSSGGVVFAGGTGAGGAASRPLVSKEVRNFSKRAMEALKGALQTATESNDNIDKVIQDAMVKFGEAELKQQGTNLIKKIPLGSALLVGAKISVAMAEGMGKELQNVNQELSVQYRKDLELSEDTGDGLSPEAVEAISRLRRWQLASTQELEPIVRAGVRAAVEKAANLAFATGGQVLENGLNRFAHDLANNSEILTFASQMIDDLIGNPDAQEREGQARMVRYLIERYVAQIEKSRFRDALNDTVKSFKGDKPIVIEIFAGMAHALKEATKDTAEPYALDLERALLNRIAKVETEIAADSSIQIKDSQTSDVEVEGNEIRIPPATRSIISAHQGVLDANRIKAGDAAHSFFMIMQIASEELETLAWEIQARALKKSIVEYRDLHSIIYNERNNKIKDLRLSYQQLENTIRTIHLADDGTPTLSGTALTAFIKNELFVSTDIKWYDVERRSSSIVEVTEKYISIFVTT